MISVLIPVYNFPVKEMVNQLHSQLKEEKIPFEILLFDDGSSRFSAQYEHLERLNNLTVFKSEENVGRSKARNLLASEANYDFFIFLDCDSLLVNDTFISNYVKNQNEEKVVIGGRRYKKEHPAINQLHWLYGVKRETLDQQGFKSNNFLISKKVYLQVQFDETLRQYGHEDTLFGIHLREQGVEVKHIQNPVYHIGLEDNETFMRKSLLAVENAWKLHREGKIEVSDIRLLKVHHKWTTSFLGRVLLIFIRNNCELWRRYCLARKPRLFALDFLKICKLEELNQKEHLAE